MMADDHHDSEISQCDFIDNSSQSYGGAIYLENRGVIYPHGLPL